MILMILTVAEKITDVGTMPKAEPSIKKFMLGGANTLTFAESLRKLILYANIYNFGIIPSNLNCISKVGGA